ncbi:MAG: hypothetical protein JXR83_17885 [Deltaproteobacteria bacterium]|nr:hypothetical protein [Deltaproteobacteria bacterium]
MGTKSGLFASLGRVARSITGKGVPVPESPAAPPVEKKPERRRDSRNDLVIPGYIADAVEIVLPPHDSVHPVRDLSLRGLCLHCREAEAAMPAIGSEVDAQFVVGQRSLPVRLQFVNQRGQFYGCRVIDPTVDWMEVVSEIIDPCRMGRRLREIDPQYVRQDDDAFTARWFQGGPACDLYLWSDGNGELARAQLFFNWQLVEWRRDQGLRTGRATNPPHTSAGYASADLFQMSDTVDLEVLAAAQRLVNSARLPDEIRALFFPDPAP